MVSDMLANAVLNLQECLSERPDAYDDILPEVQRVISCMDALMGYLDTHPDKDVSLAAVRLVFERQASNLPSDVDPPVPTT